MQLEYTDWEPIILAAKRYSLLPYLKYALEKQSLLEILSRSQVELLESAYETASIQNLQNYSALTKIIAAFNHNNIPCIIFKGAYLAKYAYPEVGLREMHDVDILVRLKDIHIVKEIVEENGFETIAPYDFDPAEHKRHLPVYWNENGTLLEIHWRITHSGYGEQIHESVFWERAVRRELYGIDTMFLSAEDELLFICYHGSVGHTFGYGLRFLCDIQMLTNHPAIHINWRDFVQHAKQWGWTKGVFLSLKLAREMLKVNFPDYVLDELEPIDYEEKIYESAFHQITTPPTAHQADNDQVGFYLFNPDNRNIGKFLAMVKENVLPSRFKLAKDYGLDTRVWYLPLYYFVNIYRRTAVLAAFLWNRMVGKSEEKAALERLIRLRSWLADI